MQLSENPITKIIYEKLKYKNFNNLNNLIFDKDRLSNFQFTLNDLKVDITRQSLDNEIKNDLIDLAKTAKVKEKIYEMVSGLKINKSEARSVGHLNSYNKFNSWNSWSLGCVQRRYASREREHECSCLR